MLHVLEATQARLDAVNAGVQQLKLVTRTKLARSFGEAVLHSQGRSLTLKSVETMLHACTSSSRQNKVWNWDDTAATTPFNAMVNALTGQMRTAAAATAAPAWGALALTPAGLSTRTAAAATAAAARGALALTPAGLSTAGVSAPVFVAELPEVGVRPTPGNMGSGEMGDFGYHCAPQGGIGTLLPYSGHFSIPSNSPDASASLLRAMPGHWVLAVRGPLSQLEALCDTWPAANPVKFVPRMKLACERLGLVTEIQSGCVCLSLHDPEHPGNPCSFWFPQEAVGSLPHIGARGGAQGHSVRVLDDQKLVERLCNTKPDASPVQYVKAVGKVLGQVGKLMESRGQIVRVEFTVIGDGGLGAGGNTFKRRLTEISLWLPKEVVVLITPWVPDVPEV
jgi:hypothetical protein